MSGGGDSGPSEAGRKPTLLRIKRRRGEAATEEIIVATAQARGDPKRLRMDQMLLQLSGLGMSHVEGGATAAPDVPKRQRFRRVTTVDMQTFQNKTAGEMERMVAAWSGGSQAEQQQQQKQQQQPSAADTSEGYVTVPTPEPGAAPTPSAQATQAQLTEQAAAEQGVAVAGASGAEEGGAGVGAGAALTPRRQGPKALPAGAGSAEAMKEALRDMAMQRSATARYMQVKSRRHAARAEQQEQQEREALQSAFHIYDLVCTDVDEGAAAARAERRRQAKERAAKAAAEGAILMNYMPMVQEFLEQQGQAAPEAAKQLPSGDANPSAPSKDTPEGEEGEEDEFVYDVYLPVQPGAQGDDMDQDTAQGVPVVEVEDEDDLFAEYAASDHDSEDSNAESYYANSYPDEDEFGSDSDEDEEGWYHVQRNAPRWDDEEYDTTKDEDEAFVPHVPGERPAARPDPRAELGLAKPRGAGARGGGAGRQQGEWGFRVR